jgi:ubiquinone/menaquinone biosynthesis C-methylase UbiE
MIRPPSGRWERGRLLSGLYDAGVQRQWVGRLLARLLWRADARRFYAEAGVLGRLPEAAAVLDVPCGGGVLFGGLAAPGPLLVACDVSPAMLRRARRRMPEGRSRLQLVLADAEALPLAGAQFDLCLTENGLHCLLRPQRAVVELARVLTPGGELRGTVVASGCGRWPDAFIAAALRIGLFRTRVRHADLARWLAESGLEHAVLEQSGALLYFSARRPTAR